MRRIVLAVAAVSALLVPLGAAPRPRKSGPPPLYWATAIGTEWEYDYKAGIDTSRVKRTVIRAEPINGGVLVAMDREWGGKTAPDGQVFVSGDGLRAVPAGSKRVDAGHWLLKRPVIPQRAWELPREGWDPPVVTYETVGVETVKVPAGTFEAVRVDCVVRRGGVEHGRGSCWYARDVGLVKRTNHAEDSEVLISFTVGKGGAVGPAPPGR